MAYVELTTANGGYNRNLAQNWAADYANRIVSNEEAERKSAVDTLQNSIDSEAETRDTADKKLQETIDTISATANNTQSELDTVKGDVSDLKTKVSDEVTARGVADNDLYAYIDNNVDSLENTDREIQRSIYTIINDISDEADIRREVDSTLSDLIADEQITRSNEDKAIRTSISALTAQAEGTYAELAAADKANSQAIADLRKTTYTADEVNALLQTKVGEAVVTPLVDDVTAEFALPDVLDYPIEYDSYKIYSGDDLLATVSKGESFTTATKVFDGELKIILRYDNADVLPLTYYGGDDEYKYCLCAYWEDLARVVCDDVQERFEKLKYYGDADIEITPQSHFSATLDDNHMLCSIEYKGEGVIDENDETTAVIYDYQDTNVVIPYKWIENDKEYLVTHLSSDAFLKNEVVESIIIPNSVTHIHESAFEGCINLTDIEIPDSVFFLDKQTFKGCTSLKSITIPRGVANSPTSLFSGCTNLESVTYLNNINAISIYTFRECTNLKHVYLPDSVKTISGHVFENCKALTSITLPKNIATIGAYAFYGCENLTSIVIPDGVSLLNGHTFDGCIALKSVTIPNSVKKISFPFGNCTALASITIPESVVNINSNAFKDCLKVATEEQKANGTEVAPFEFCCYKDSYAESYYNVNYADTEGITCTIIDDSGSRRYYTKSEIDEKISNLEQAILELGGTI